MRLWRRRADRRGPHTLGRPALRLLPEPRPEGRRHVANVALLLWAIGFLIVALLLGIWGAFEKGLRQGERAALGFPRGVVAGLLVDSLLRRAEALNRASQQVEQELRAFHGLRAARRLKPDSVRPVR